VNTGNTEGEGLAAPRLSYTDDVSSGEERRPSAGLDGRRLVEFGEERGDLGVDGEGRDGQNRRVDRRSEGNRVGGEVGV
jgi:hypothetical protein